MPITARQKRVLDYIKDYYDLHQEAPTIAEIGKQFSMSSSASAHNVVAILEREGFIRRIPNVSRGIQLVNDGEAEARN
jgi:repressor LexA